MDTIKLTPEQRKALEGHEAPEPPKPLRQYVLNVLAGMVRERIFGAVNGRATHRQRCLVWTSFTAIRWHQWSHLWSANYASK